MMMIRSNRSIKQRRRFLFKTTNTAITRVVLLLLSLIVFIVLLPPNHHRVMAQEQGGGEQVKWTSNPDDDDGSNPSLPLSMKQRKQLLQLQHTIMSSENPEATLSQAAQSNNMSVSDLTTILEKNARDLQSNPSLLEPTMLPQLVWKSFLAVVTSMINLTKRRPRIVATIASTTILMIYLSTVIIPQTGFQLSTQRHPIFSPNGPTTIWSPPDSYLQQQLSSSSLLSSSSSSMHDRQQEHEIGTIDDNDDDEEENEDVDVQNYDSSSDSIYQVRRLMADDIINKIDSTTTTRQKYNNKKKTISTTTKKKEDGENVDDDDDDNDNNIDQREEIAHMLFVNARKTLIDRRLTEFVQESDTSLSSSAALSSAAAASKLSFPIISKRNYIRGVISDENVDLGLFVIPGSGDFGRYGLMFWRVTDETDESTTEKENDMDDDFSYGRSTSLTLTTLKRMAPFDGQIVIHIRQVVERIGKTDDDDDDIGEDEEDLSAIGIKIQVDVIHPKGENYKHLSKRSALDITKQLAASIEQSAVQTTLQTLARRKQGRRFSKSGSQRASERRNTRFERERLLEIMAEDRRRRWQRRNPDAGRWRPSGHRQLSPNNC